MNVVQKARFEQVITPVRAPFHSVHLSQDSSSCCPLTISGSVNALFGHPSHPLPPPPAVVGKIATVTTTTVIIDRFDKGISTAEKRKEGYGEKREKEKKDVDQYMKKKISTLQIVNQQCSYKKLFFHNKGK